MSAAAVEIGLVRHFPTAWNAAGRLQGRSDIPLSDAARAELATRRLPPRWRGLPSTRIEPCIAAHSRARWMTNDTVRARTAFSRVVRWRPGGVTSSQWKPTTSRPAPRTCSPSVAARSSSSALGSAASVNGATSTPS